MNIPPKPFEQGRPIDRQLTARRLNDMERRVPRIRFSGGGARVSQIGDQVFVQFPANRGSGTSSALHPLWVYNASSGSTPKIRVTPGVYNNIVPTIAGIPINTQTGSPLAYPALTVGSSDTLVWAEISYDNTNTATSVLFNSGTALPTPTITPGTAGTDYYGLSSISVTISSSSGLASVAALNDYVDGSQGYAQCGNASNCWLK